MKQLKPVKRRRHYVVPPLAKPPPEQDEDSEADHSVKDCPVESEEAHRLPLSSEEVSEAAVDQAMAKLGVRGLPPAVISDVTMTPAEYVPKDGGKLHRLPPGKETCTCTVPGCRGPGEDPRHRPSYYGSCKYCSDPFCPGLRAPKHRDLRLAMEEEEKERPNLKELTEKQ